MAHIKSPIFGNIFLRIENVLTAFSIPEKMFPKLDGLMCALRAHIKFSVFGNIFSGIEKTVMAHISKILIRVQI